MEIQYITKAFADSIQVKQNVLADAALQHRIVAAAKLMRTSFEQAGKVLFCGNGGSAADAQHLAAELSGRFYKNRKALFAEALHVNGSFLTAVANDFGYDYAFARMVEAAGKPNDVLVAISTSGNSPSILQAAQVAKAQGMHVIGLTGSSGGKLHDYCDVLVNVPAGDTPRIQECHILIGHIWCAWLEEVLFPEAN
ncbi:MAG: SIS domain-containing protein [Chitinophagales bacterium]